MRGYHDLGGQSAGPVTRVEHDYALWEKRVDALLPTLVNKGIMTLDEHRRMHESLGDVAYETLTYYERWMAATTNVLIVKGHLTIAELAKKMIEVEGRRS